MKKQILPFVAGVMLLLVPQNSLAQINKERIHFGAEWGFTLSGYKYRNFSYYDSMDIHVTENDASFKAKASGYADVFIGIDFKQTHNVSFRSGYSYITDSRVGVPITLRYTNNINGTTNNGPFIFAETGIWIDKTMSTGSLGKIGIGYRKKLSRRKCLDISTSARIINDYPPIIEPGTIDIVPEDKISNNYAAYLSLSASLALNF